MASYINNENYDRQRHAYSRGANIWRSCEVFFDLSFAGPDSEINTQDDRKTPNLLWVFSTNHISMSTTSGKVVGNCLGTFSGEFLGELTGTDFNFLMLGISLCVYL